MAARSHSASAKPHVFEVESVDPATLTPHPRNYAIHSNEQLSHLRQSLRQFGWYRNIVVAADDVVLAGHGILQAAIAEGHSLVPIVRLTLQSDDPRAIKVLVADNEVRHLAESNDTELIALLLQIGKETDQGLLGTGYDEAMLSALRQMTAPPDMLEGLDAAAEWEGMPAYTRENMASSYWVCEVRCQTSEDRDEFMRSNNFTVLGEGMRLAVRYPVRQREDLQSVAIEG